MLRAFSLVWCQEKIIICDAGQFSEQIFLLLLPRICLLSTASLLITVSIVIVVVVVVVADVVVVGSQGKNKLFLEKSLMHEEMLECLRFLGS